jgi:hypothetical protein
MPADAAKSNGRRPTLSMMKTAGIVVTTLIMPVMPVARRDEVFEVRPRFVKITALESDGYGFHATVELTRHVVNDSIDT